MAQPRKRKNTEKDPVPAKKKKIIALGKKGNIHQTKRFPVQQIHELLETKFPGGTVKAEAAVYLTGVLEYVAAEILELSANAARTRCSGKSGQFKVALEDMISAIDSDIEIKELTDKVRLANAASKQGINNYSVKK
ncbi:histone H2A-like [Argiope bruennichi]|uniref:histone H2A-like n=1 Tax=Argiope bruennichi TaxID=94029 RepID=UPI00249438AC|nr:histone H2A-like [Argiope bruennichi]